MNSKRQIGYVFLALGVLIMIMLAPSPSSGQIVSDQTFGPSNEAPLNEGVIVMPQEAFPKELDQRFERSMQAPEISSETTKQLLIRTPDQQDLENARESDLRSRADTTWVDEIGNSLHVYQTNYPTSNWEPYSHKLDVVKQAVANGDQRTVKSEMGKWFKMLRVREHGINDVAADELFNFALLVTPIQEYGISIPAASGGTSELTF